MSSAATQKASKFLELLLQWTQPNPTQPMDNSALHQVALTVHHPYIKLTLWPTFCFQKNFVSDRTDLTSSDGLCPSPPWSSSRRPVEEKVATVMVKISRIVGDVHINHSYSSGGVFLSPRCTPQALTRSVQPLLQGTRSRSVHRW